MKKRLLIPMLIVGALILIIVIYSAASDTEKAVVLTSEVKQGTFEIIVTVTGELQAESSVEIRAPAELRGRNVRIRSIKIQNIIPEGTVVDSGDWVATLDRSEADISLKDMLDELERVEAQFTKIKIDTTINLRQLRNELINLEFNMEEMKIALAQSQFEPPATIRQAQINLDKATRAYEQAKYNYDLKVKQTFADMTSTNINMQRTLRSIEEMQDLIKKFDIYAPSPGMVIYQKEYNGSKRTVGSEINSYDLIVATLPDLSSLISKTYVNEIDISKIRVGQEVRIGVDAFPEKSFTGVVKEVANIGEQLPNTDAKVFEVIIRLNQIDDILRPSMTTSNQIVTRQVNDVMYIPLEAVHTNDSMTYVFTSKGVRQVVILGESNDNHIIVEEGLKGNETLYLSMPEEPEKFRIEGKELVAKIQARKAEEEKRKLEMQEQFERRQGQRPIRQIQNGEFSGRRPRGEMPANGSTTESTPRRPTQ
jgi:multidrug efflux pump subunit AcrA (membrane-fusion protein)